MRWRGCRGAGPALLCVAVLLAQLLAHAAAQGAQYTTRIEAASNECYTEMVEAGARVTFSFRVTDGGRFDIDATMAATSSPPLRDWGAVTRLHYNDFSMGLRDRTETHEVATWQRASEGEKTYTAASAAATKHGLPTAITVCFDNAFSPESPKWVQFAFDKHPAPPPRDGTTDDIEAEMEEHLQLHASVLADAAEGARVLRDTGAADYVYSRMLANVVVAAIVVNVLALAAAATYQHYQLTRLLRRRAEERGGRARAPVRVAAA